VTPTRAMALYGFSAYDDGTVDDRHLLMCPGCLTCQRAEERAEREFNRYPERNYR